MDISGYFNIHHPRGVCLEHFVLHFKCFWGGNKRFKSLSALQLLEGSSGRDKEITNLLNSVDFYLLPVTNPDGYVYSHEEVIQWLCKLVLLMEQNSSLDRDTEASYGSVFIQDRMWRKNRVPDRNNSGCIGTDLNRNFGFQWGGGKP